MQAKFSKQWGDEADEAYKQGMIIEPALVAPTPLWIAYQLDRPATEALAEVYVTQLITRNRG